MYVVALVTLATPVDAEAAALAADLGATVYEQRLQLAGEHAQLPGDSGALRGQQPKL